MIHITQEVASRLVPILYELQRNADNREDIVGVYRNAVIHAEQATPFEDVHRAILRQDEIEGDFTAEMLFGEALDSIVPQLLGQSEGSAEGEVSLVEKLVEVLQQPFAINRLQGQALADLRWALLNVEERTGLFSRLEKAEMRCRVCGIEFATDEVATFGVLDDTAGFACAKCRRPRQQACGHPACEEKVAKQIESVKCAKHSEEETKKAEEGTGLYTFTAGMLNAPIRWEEAPAEPQVIPNDRLRQAAERLRRTPNPFNAPEEAVRERNRALRNRR